MSPVSFPFPPPPTVMGMIGAICGYNKTEYHDKNGWEQIKIGVGIRNPIKKLRAGINLVNTKEKPFSRLSGENPRIQIPHEFLKDACFRIYVAKGKKQMMDELSSHLKSGTNTYTVSLGLAQCLAIVKYIGTFDACAKPEGEYSIDTVVLTDLTEKIQYSADGSYGHYRIPIKMTPKRKVLDYKVVVTEENGKRIQAVSDQVFSVGSDNVIFF